MKKVLKQQASEIDAYIKRKHTQEECIGFMDGFERANELFALYNVSQHRELLLAYHKYLDSLNDPTVYNASESIIDDYLANNCG